MATAILIRTSVDNGHAHTARLDEDGNGKTSPGGPDSHTHDVVAFKRKVYEHALKELAPCVFPKDTLAKTANQTINREPV